MLRRVMAGLLGGVLGLAALLMIFNAEWFVGAFLVFMAGTLLGYAFGLLKGQGIEQQIWGKRARGGAPPDQPSQE